MPPALGCRHGLLKVHFPPNRDRAKGLLGLYRTAWPPRPDARGQEPSALMRTWRTRFRRSSASRSWACDTALPENARQSPCRSSATWTSNALLVEKPATVDLLI